MNINVQDIFDFYETRIKCHVQSMNYFASLLGYHFPEHDSDKVIEPIRTGYSYIFYKTYHKNFHPTQQHIDLCNDAIRLHHFAAAHHIQHYKNVTEIPDINLYEMVADWASANFEQMNIIHDPESVSIQTWFNNKMAQLPWSKKQLEIIQKSFEIIEKNTDEEKVKSIWQPVLEHADL
ncbi:MAG: hypothetical protein IKN73_03440 [Alphaproteobacteria bacterium]|nr:hypothetical protein [Alphaproteobacteria bacterium]